MNAVVHYLRVALTPPEWQSPWSPGLEAFLPMVALAFWWGLALVVALLPLGLLVAILYLLWAHIRDNQD
jgi:hypothetical protein